jgi:hypothetical protein
MLLTQKRLIEQLFCHITPFALGDSLEIKQRVMDVSNHR